MSKTISSFLSAARGLIFSPIKNDLLNFIIDNTEYSEEEIQIPELKFERLNVASNLEKKKNELMKLVSNNLFLEDLGEANNRGNPIEENMRELLKNSLSPDESLFLQAFSQYKNIDISSFRSKKFPGDPKVAFKVLFNNEFVQGIGGPYRQLFSDISRELNNDLLLLTKTKNNLDQKGEFKDKFTVNNGYDGVNALEQFEFLGVLMGICVRTGVHLSLDLCSVVWKMMVDERITGEDINQFDEGLYNLIKTLYFEESSSSDSKKKEGEKEINTSEVIEKQEENEEKQEENVLLYCTYLTDGTEKNLVENGNKKELIISQATRKEKIDYIKLLMNVRLNESINQINAIKKGLSKMIPLSLLKLLTASDLERLVCGVREIDIKLLKENT